MCRKKVKTQDYTKRFEKKALGKDKMCKTKKLNYCQKEAYSGPTYSNQFRQVLSKIINLMQPLDEQSFELSLQLMIQVKDGL